MLTIRKGSHCIRVSKCTYNDMFKKLGYQIVNENSKEEVEKTSSDEQKDNLEKELEEKLIEKEQKENELKDDLEEIKTSESLNVNIIGEKVEDTKSEKVEKTSFEKVLEEKLSKKGK